MPDSVDETLVASDPDMDNEESTSSEHILPAYEAADNASLDLDLNSSKEPVLSANGDSLLGVENVASPLDRQHDPTEDDFGDLSNAAVTEDNGDGGVKGADEASDSDDDAVGGYETAATASDQDEPLNDDFGDFSAPADAAVPTEKTGAVNDDTDDATNPLCSGSTEESNTDAVELAEQPSPSEGDEDVGGYETAMTESEKDDPFGHLSTPQESTDYESNGATAEVAPLGSPKDQDEQKEPTDVDSGDGSTLDAVEDTEESNTVGLDSNGETRTTEIDDDALLFESAVANKGQDTLQDHEFGELTLEAVGDADGTEEGVSDNKDAVLNDSGVVDEGQGALQADEFVDLTSEAVGDANGTKEGVSDFSASAEAHIETGMTQDSLTNNEIFDSEVSTSGVTDEGEPLKSIAPEETHGNQLLSTELGEGNEKKNGDLSGVSYVNNGDHKAPDVLGDDNGGDEIQPILNAEEAEVPSHSVDDQIQPVVLEPDAIANGQMLVSASDEQADEFGDFSAFNDTPESQNAASPLTEGNQVQLSLDAVAESVATADPDDDFGDFGSFEQAEDAEDAYLAENKDPPGLSGSAEQVQHEVQQEDDDDFGDFEDFTDFSAAEQPEHNAVSESTDVPSSNSDIRQKDAEGGSDPLVQKAESVFSEIFGSRLEEDDLEINEDSSMRTIVLIASVVVSSMCMFPFSLSAHCSHVPYICSNLRYLDCHRQASLTDNTCEARPSEWSTGALLSVLREVQHLGNDDPVAVVNDHSEHPYDHFTVPIGGLPMTVVTTTRGSARRRDVPTSFTKALPTVQPKSIPPSSVPAQPTPAVPEPQPSGTVVSLPPLKRESHDGCQDMSGTEDANFAAFKSTQDAT